MQSLLIDHLIIKFGTIMYVSDGNLLKHIRKFPNNAN